MPAQGKSILFVCKGNICRSNFAEKRAVKFSGHVIQYRCSSAGIQVDDPKPPPEEAIIAAESMGINIAPHRSRGLDYSMIESHDMIVAMEAWQWKYLRKICQENQEKIFLLPLFDNHSGTSWENYNIRDPYGKDIEEFKQCYGRIERCLSGLFLALGNHADSGNR